MVIPSGVTTGGVKVEQNAPLSEKFDKNQEKGGKVGKREEN